MILGLIGVNVVSQGRITDFPIRDIAIAYTREVSKHSFKSLLIDICGIITEYTEFI